METNTKEQLELLLKFMQQKRSTFSGFGAPISMLKGIINGEDVSGFAKLIEQSEDYQE